jgi:hypothetical protein
VAQPQPEYVFDDPLAVSVAFGGSVRHRVLVLIFTPALLSAHESLHERPPRWLALPRPNQ